ncbi:MAG: hypothetical protein HC806_06910 [Anaerolineae bacterium]|nr:hypothetical protein [Anaerolineae bacterium]
MTAPDWEVELDGPFEVVLAFAVLHHLPMVFVPRILQKVRSLLTHPHLSTPSSSFRKAQPADANAPLLPAPLPPSFSSSPTGNS